DTVPPTICGCPNDMSAVIELGTPTAVVGRTEPTATDLSGTVIMTSRSNGPGESFSIGLTTVAYIFSDASGNAASCSFVVTVITEGITPPMIVNCPSLIERQVELGVPGLIITWTEPSATDISGTAMLVDRTHAPNDFFPVGITKVIYTFTDSSQNGAVCSFIISITIVDTTPPECVNLPAFVSESTELGNPGRRVTWIEPTCQDISNVASVTARSNLPGSFFLVGDTVVTYTCTDGSGNSDTCSFPVQVFTIDTLRPQILECPDIDAPSVIATIEPGITSAIVQFDEPTATDASNSINVESSCNSGDRYPRHYPPEVFQCPDEIRAIVELGITSTVVFYDEPFATDNSNAQNLLQTQTCQRGDSYPVGETSCLYLFVDPDGNSNSCTFLIIVTTIDTVPPVISDCPSQQTITIEPGQTSAQVVWFQLSATDNSGTATLQTQTHSPGESFVIGQTTVMYIFLDPAGNTANCEFIVLVQTACKQEISRRECLTNFMFGVLDEPH
ncbi:putative hyalin, partial [Apostichopus japonicus]